MRTVILKKLAALEQALCDAPRRTLLGSSLWKDDVPSLGGVYAIWSKKDGTPVYVGETYHLNHRCIDLGKTVNHTFRRKMAVAYNMQGCSDEELTKKLSKYFLYSFMPVELGRKELRSIGSDSIDLASAGNGDAIGRCRGGILAEHQAVRISRFVFSLCSLCSLWLKLYGYSNIHGVAPADAGLEALVLCEEIAAEAGGMLTCAMPDSARDRALRAPSPAY